MTDAVCNKRSDICHCLKGPYEGSFLKEGTEILLAFREGMMKAAFDFYSIIWYYTHNKENKGLELIHI